VNFALHHRFDHPADRVWATLLDPAYITAASKLSDIEKVVERDEERDGKQFVRTRCTSPRELPRIMRRAIGSDKLVYHLEEIRDHANHTLQWRVIPGALASKVKAEGSYTLRATPNGCERLVKGEVRVAIPIVGSKIEGGIGKELKTGYEKAAELTRSWLEENP
jgi:hypothetical protein